MSSPGNEICSSSLKKRRRLSDDGCIDLTCCSLEHGISAQTVLRQMYGRERVLIKALFEITGGKPNRLKPYSCEVLRSLILENKEGRYDEDLTEFINKQVEERQLREMAEAEIKFDETRKRFEDKKERGDYLKSEEERIIEEYADWKELAHIYEFPVAYGMYRNWVGDILQQQLWSVRREIKRQRSPEI
ncbi:hypothetical protein BJV82DRAFT_613605 [Fennellomyces sp. T-0311]|nr:hypothetical protein BJV82DRAFT_636684 [Fennellomyces sp. T-0311]KAI8142639.1 hypothetical protein BJV82DRAFT_613605 [Fennellomyces sp. T-0311]